MILYRVRVAQFHITRIRQSVIVTNLLFSEHAKYSEMIVKHSSARIIHLDVVSLAHTNVMASATTFPDPLIHQYHVTSVQQPLSFPSYGDILHNN